MHPTPELTALVPANPLELGLAHARAGVLPMPDFVRLLLASSVAVPSAAAVSADGRGLQPLHFDKDGMTMMAVFSGVERAAAFADPAPYVLQTTGRALLGALAPGIGVALNPMYDLRFDVLPDGVDGSPASGPILS